MPHGLISVGMMGVIMIVIIIMVKVGDHIAEQQVMMLAAMRGHVLNVRHGAGHGRLRKNQHQGRAQHGSGLSQQWVGPVFHRGRLARRHRNWQRPLR